MAETRELSDTEKLEKLSRLINGSEGEAEEKELTDLLNTVPVDLVNCQRMIKRKRDKLICYLRQNEISFSGISGNMMSIN